LLRYSSSRRYFDSLRRHRIKNVGSDVSIDPDGRTNELNARTLGGITPQSAAYLRSSDH
jgi:hypothetical protein